VQHANGGYSRCGNFGSSLVHIMFLMYLPDCTNVYGSRGAECERIVSVGAGGGGVESCKIVFIGALAIQLFRHFCCRLRRIYFATDRQMTVSVSRTPIANQTV